MKAHIAVLVTLLAVCYVPASAQTVTPSISIGTHVLTLGMEETTVLEECGDDLKLIPPQCGVQAVSRIPPNSIR